MIKHPNLIPECNVDTAFVEMCGFKDPNHAYSISQVSAILEKKMTDKKAIGFVDNDKRKPQYLKEFKEIESSNKVSLLKHPQQRHFLVVVSPAMDRFLFDLCKRLEIDLAHYNLPKEYKAFESFTKKQAIKNNAKFKNLLNTIRQKKPEEILKIQSWIDKYV